MSQRSDSSLALCVFVAVIVAVAGYAWLNPYPRSAEDALVAWCVCSGIATIVAPLCLMMLERRVFGAVVGGLLLSIVYLWRRG